MQQIQVLKWIFKSIGTRNQEHLNNMKHFFKGDCGKS